jgi:hypothetical protein
MATNTQVISFYERAYERLLQEMYAKDDLVVKLSDTLDVKASILLAAITLLATQTAYFLDKQTPGTAHCLLLCAAILLAISTVLAFAELWPRTFLMPAPETSGISRASELHGFYSQHEGIKRGNHARRIHEERNGMGAREDSQESKHK